MTGVTARLAWATGLALAAVAPGCGSSTASPYTLDVGTDDGGHVLGQRTGGDAGASTLSVSVSPAAPVVCPGKCATLSAQATGGTGPYSYTWDHGLVGDGGPVTACPAATTTYAVTATDSSGRSGTELSSAAATGSASVTVTVPASCATQATDAGPSGDGGAIVVVGLTDIWLAGQPDGASLAAPFLSTDTAPTNSPIRSAGCHEPNGS